VIEEHPIIWLQIATCSGCTISVLNALSPNIRNLLVDEILQGKQIKLLFHTTIMGASREPAIEVLRGSAKIEEGYILIVEGAIPTAEGGIHCHLVDSALAELGIGLKAFFSVLGRHIARALDCKILADLMVEWVLQLKPDKQAYVEHALPEEGIGVGLTEAPRGALGH
jgi:hypothetical protein